jgi:hypothetical protein
LEYGIYTGASERQIRIAIITAKSIRILEQKNPASKIVGAQFKQLIGNVEIAAKSLGVIGPEEQL